MDERAGGGRGRLGVFAKYPRPGSVKTRLVPPLTDEEAADLYAAMLCDSLHVYRALPEVEPLLFIAEESDVEPSRRLLRECGVIADGESFPIYSQCGADLGERLVFAFADLFAFGSEPAAVIGTDHPSLPSRYLTEMFTVLKDYDLVLGPADDGGYYTIGLREPQPELFRDMPWSTSDLFRRTVARAAALGLRTRILPEWYDVDNRRTLRRLMEDCALGNVGPMVAAALARIGEVHADLLDPTDEASRTDKGEGEEGI